MREPDSILLLYRISQINVHLLNASFSSVALPSGHLYAITALTMSIFCSIHFFGKLPLAAYGIFPVLGALAVVFISISFCLGPGIIDAAEKLRKDLRDNLHKYPPSTRAHLMRTVKSFNDPKVTCGSFFFYQWSTIPTTCHIAVDYAFTLLIGFK